MSRREETDCAQVTADTDLPLTFRKSLTLHLSYFMCSTKELAHISRKITSTSDNQGIYDFFTEYFDGQIFKSSVFPLKILIILSAVYLLILSLVLKYYKLYKRRDYLCINVI